MKRASTLASSLILVAGFVGVAPGYAEAQPPAQPAGSSGAVVPPAAAQPAPASSTPPPAAAAAQPASGAVSPAPSVPGAPPPSSEPVWIGTVATPPPTAAYAPATSACVPACRLGYACVSASCVPSCNPPCAAKEVCSDRGTCERPTPPPKPGAHRHDGFLLRATGVTGITSLRVDSGNSRGVVKDGGLSGATAIDVGAALIDNFIVRGRLSASWELLTKSPFSSRGDIGDVAFLFGTVGVGADYYFMPVNLYVGATLALAGGSMFEDKTRTRDALVLHSKAGLGIDLDVGKEWWLTGNWGMGAALRVSILSMGAANIVPNSDGPLTALQVGVMFSATYN